MGAVYFNIVPVCREDAGILARLWPLYQYDMSEVGGTPINAYGLFEDDSLRDHDYRTDLETWWRQPDRFYPFLIRVDGRAAGFALVTATDGAHAIDEFFILRGFRRRGIARKVAKELFACYPGRWELSVYIENAPALAFWRRMVNESAAEEVVERPAGSEAGLSDMIEISFRTHR